MVGVTAFGMVAQLLVAVPARADDATAADPSESVSSSPPDLADYSQVAGPSRRALAQPALSPDGVFTIDPSLSSSSAGGGEPSMAVNPANPNQIVIARFATAWNANADILFSNDGGITWTDQATIPTPAGVAGTSGCPCDQTFDWGSDGRLYGTFLTCTPNGSGGCSATSVVTGSTANPTQASSWTWNGTQLTSGTRTNVDQPWLVVNRDPTTASQVDVYVGYDDFAGTPHARVAVSRGANPVNFTVDNQAGTESPLATNPGLRLAADPRNGTTYALYEQSTGTSQPKSVTYRLNRSTDSGATWTLNGNADGLVVDTVNSDQAPGFKFGNVNALLGGVDHAAVDPNNGDVYVVYGQDVSGGNRIMIRRLTANGSGGLNVGGAANVSAQSDTALPSIAILSDGTIGVLYHSFDGNNGSGVPTFSVHLARSTNQGASFSDTLLQSFTSPVTDNSNARQRIFGDYQQIKAVGTTFYGVFSGNRNGFGSSTSAIDPIFFSLPQRTEMTITSSANPSLFTQPVSFNATVVPVPDGGTVSFTADAVPLGGPVAVNTTNGTATSASTSTMTPGSHTVVATYSGNANFKSSSATLSQVVNRSPTTTTYTGPTTADFNDTFTASATLTGFGGAPVVGRTVTFKLGAGTGTETCSGVTDATGTAKCALTAFEPFGTYTLTAEFAGDIQYEPSSDSVSFTITKEQTAVHYTGPTLVPNGQNVTFSAVLLEDDATPIAGRTVTITIGSGGTAQSCSGVTNALGVATCSILVSQPLGPGMPIHVQFAGDAVYLPSSDDATALVFAFLDRGIFAIGEGKMAKGDSVTYWGARWAKDNTLSGGAAPNSFKGFAPETSTQPAACGGDYSAGPGNSGGPPSSVPSYMAVAVSSQVAMSGSTITGDIVHIVIVKTDPGYAANPGHPGTGVIVAQLC
ncbi:MAG: Ig-like domain-containing protein [Chloroflexota bacterium]